MNWKSLFVNETNETVEPTKASKPLNTTEKVTISAPVSISSVSQVKQEIPQSSSVSSSDKQQFMEYLKTKYEEANIPGPDYQEFIKTIEEMSHLAMDNKSKFTTAFITFKSLGVTKQKLIDSGNQYIKFFEDQVNGFNKEIENTFNTEVVQKQKEANKLKSEIEEIEKQMQLLTEKKLKNNELFNKLTSDINDQVSTLNSQKNTFEIVAKEYCENISKNLSDINTYLV